MYFDTLRREVDVDCVAEVVRKRRCPPIMESAVHVCANQLCTQTHLPKALSADTGKRRILTTFFLAVRLLKRWFELGTQFFQVLVKYKISIIVCHWLML